jgi:small-conductance mechanosensitive channel
MTLEVMRDVTDQVITHFEDSWLEWILAGLKILIVIIAAKITIKMLNKAIMHIANEKDRFRFNPRRSTTIIVLVGNVVKYAVNFVMILIILNELGIPLGPMLAGAGVVGLAIGFGAQSLVKDVITGFFIIFEDQFAVGDVIKTGGFSGTVEEIGLRVTKVKSETGELHIIPNGSIQQVTNYSIHNSIAIIDVTIAYEKDIDKALAIIGETAARVHASSQDIVRPPLVLGVQTVGPAQVVLRVTCECKPNKQDDVIRIMNAEIKKSLDEGI